MMNISELTVDHLGTEVYIITHDNRELRGVLRNLGVLTQTILKRGEDKTKIKTKEYMVTTTVTADIGGKFYQEIISSEKHYTDPRNLK